MNLELTDERPAARIARAIRRGDRLDDPREARLAVVMAQRHQLIAFEVALAGALFVIVGLLWWIGENRIRQRLQDAVQANRARAGSGGELVGQIGSPRES